MDASFRLLKSLNSLHKDAMKPRNLKTLSVIAQKGGVGKTTLAINIAVLAASQKWRTALIDCDPQRSSAAWWNTREATDVTLIERPAADLDMIQAAARNDGFDLLVVDTRPSVEGDTIHAVKAADAVVVPTRPGILDLRAVQDTVRLVKNANKAGCVVLNQCPPPRHFGEPTLTSEARAVALELGLPVAPAVISNRVALSYSLNDGRAVTEYEPEGRAADEIRSLWSYIRKAYLNG